MTTTLISLFQSSPGQKAGCNIASSATFALKAGFQSSPGQKARCNPVTDYEDQSMYCFNPHPARRPGATRVGRRHRLPQRVSILTRPEGRVQPSVGANVYETAAVVSILTRPEGRVQPMVKGQLKLARRVSILTRPEGRVQPLAYQQRQAVLSEVSILTRPEGRVQPPVGPPYLARPECFNPHPARRPGATCQCRQRHHRSAVSILTRPEGRVQPPQSMRTLMPAGGSFNPHPARRPGAT